MTLTNQINDELEQKAWVTNPRGSTDAKSENFQGDITLTVHISQVICMDCDREMRLLEGTDIRKYNFFELEVKIEVIEQ